MSLTILRKGKKRKRKENNSRFNFGSEWKCLNLLLKSFWRQVGRLQKIRIEWSSVGHQIRWSRFESRSPKSLFIWLCSSSSLWIKIELQLRRCNDWQSFQNKSIQAALQMLSAFLERVFLQKLEQASMKKYQFLITELNRAMWFWVHFFYSHTLHLH